MKVTAANNSSTSDTSNVIFVVPINLGDTVKICSGLTATLNAGPGYNSYTWNTGAKTQEITVDSAGKYTVSGVINGVTVSDSVMVIILPTTVFSLGMDTTLISNETLLLSAPKGNYSYLWSDGSKGDSLVIIANNYTDTVLDISVSVTNSYLCKKSDTMLVSVNNRTGITLNAGAVTVILYPNPVHGALTVEMNNFKGDIAIDMENMMGQVIFEKQIASVSNYLNYSIEHHRNNLTEFMFSGLRTA